MSKRKLWIDTRGEPVATTTPNGESNARWWGWTEAVAVPTAERDALQAKLDKVKAIHERVPINSNFGGVTYICNACERSWPCPTIQALGGDAEC